MITRNPTNSVFFLNDQIQSACKPQSGPICVSKTVFKTILKIKSICVGAVNNILMRKCEHEHLSEPPC